VTSEPESRYWSFISYSSRDAGIARRLHRSLEAYAIPRAMVGRQTRRGTIPRRLFPIFRDRDELPLSSDLGSTLQDALRASRHLIVLCSPHAAASRWVNEEVRFFKELGRGDRILAIIVGGEPNAADRPGLPPELECFPPALRFVVDAQGRLTDERAEPLAGDLRPGGDGWNAVLLKCVAGITGLSFDDLRQRDQIRRRQRFRALAASTLALLTVLAALLGWGVYQGQQARRAGKAAGEAKAQAKTDRSKRQFQEYLDDMRDVARLWRQSEATRAAQIVERHKAFGAGKLEWSYWRNVINSASARTFQREGATWTGLALDDSGNLLAAVTEGGNLVVWDLRTGKIAYEIEGDVRAVKHTSGFFVTLPMPPEGMLRVFRADNGDLVQQSQSRFAGSLAVYGEGNSLESSPRAAVGNIAGEILLFDLLPHPQNRMAEELTRYLGRSVGGDRPLDAQHGAATALSFGKDDSRLAVGYEDGAAQVWQIDGERQIIARVPPGNAGPVAAIAASPSGNLIAMQTRGGLQRGAAIGSKLSVWQAATGVVNWTKEVHASNTAPAEGDPAGFLSVGDLSIAFSPDESKIYSTGDRAVLVWDALRGDRLPDLKGSTNRVLAVAVSSDGRLVAGGGADGAIRVWETGTSPGVTIICDTYTYAQSVVLSDDGLRIAARCEEGERMRSPDGKLLSDACARVWSVPEGKFLESTPGIGLSLRALRYDSAEDRFLFSDTSPAEAKVNAKLSHVQLVEGLADPQHRYVLSTVGGGLAGLELRPAGTNVPAIVLTQKQVTVIAISPRGNGILAGFGDGQVVVWSHSGVELSSAKLHDGEVTAAVWNDAGSVFATGGADRSIALCNGADGRLLKRLDGHRCEVSGLTFDATATRLVSSSGLAQIQSEEPGEVLIWDVETGQQCLSLGLDAPYRFSGVAISAVGDIYAAANSVTSTPGNQQSRIVRWNTAPRSSQVTK
jgi:WD40 repeat protein